MPQYLGHYEVVRELGAGAFGRVLLAEGEVPRRSGSGGRRRKLVAIKQLHDSTDDKARVALAREFELMDRVRHRSLVRVYEYIPDIDAVVMEVVRGCTLDDVLCDLDERQEAMPVGAILDLAMELLDCLYQAFSTPGEDGTPLQLVHRDMKPENVMITPSGEVKILDFGLARARRAGDKRERSVMGTPLYMAPEQALGLHIDHRTDLFAVALILYECVMGRSAYEINDRVSDPEADVYDRIEAGDLDQQIEELLHARPQVGEVIESCLAADARDRPTDGHEVMIRFQALQTSRRGVSLTEFCEYFFSEVHPLPAEDVLTSGRRPSGGASDSNRRKESMSDKPPRPGPPRPGGGPPRPGGPAKRGGPARPTGGGPRSASGAPPRAGGPPRPGGGPPRPGGGPPRPGGGPPRPGGGPMARRGPPGGRGPGRPPGPVGAAMPSAPAVPGPPEPGPRDVADALSKSGARKADDDGMLEMVRLIDEADEDEDDQPKSATAFFQIPKSARRKAPSAPPAGAAPRLGAPSAAPGLPGPGGFPGGPPPMAGGPPPIAGGAVSMIQGPVAGGAIGGPVAPAPFAGSTDEPDWDDAVGSNRTRSFVTIGIILLMLGFLGLAAVVAAGGIGYMIYLQQEDAQEGGGDSGALHLQGPTDARSA